MLLRVFMVALLICSALALAVQPSATGPAADRVTWQSPATGGTVAGTILAGNGGADQARAVVVYMKNLSVPRPGREGDQTILADLVAQGNVVVVLDYGHHPKAVSPDLNADLLKLREDVSKHRLLADRKVDLAHLFILAEGFRLRRDVEFARDGNRVLAMDVQYPSQPERPAPVLMEITCDNVNRMGTGSLVFCHDTLLDGGQFAGFATAMVDHPVAPPYKGIDDPMPECVWRLKAAVRVLRSMSGELGFSGNIGAVGFSRGSEMAGFLAATGGRQDLEGPGGPAAGVSSRVQAALVHGARYDYTAVGPDDPMYTGFKKAWGPRDQEPDRWARHGVAYYMTRDAVPMYLNTSDGESKEFREGLARFARRLDELGVEHVYTEDRDGRGHRVSTDPGTLSEVYRFFREHLADRPGLHGR